MPASTQRGDLVMYVARSAREFPREVQDWLGAGDHRAAASPNLYDALASLTRRQRPVAIIVSIESVDWEEMEFFDLAARLSRHTRIYVAGHESHRARIEAALQRGARLFDPDDLAMTLAEPATAGPRSGTHDLLAATLQSFPEAPGRQLHITRLPEEAEPAEPAPPAPTPTPAGAGPTPETTDKPAVRLIGPADVEDDSLSPPDEAETPIPFPWSPSPKRPQRTPPSARTGPSAGAGNPPAAPPADPKPAPSARPTPAELTPEELAALMGKPVDLPPGTRQEPSP